MATLEAQKKVISLDRGYRPTDDEPFMNDRQREYFRRKLLAWKDQILEESRSTYVISGETNLLDAEDLSSNMARLRDLFKLFEQKTGLMQLLDISNRAQGVQIFIGGESGLSPLDDCSVVTAPYEVDGQLVGSVGVIGPTRMAYERVIPIVDITARLLTSALSGQN